MKLYIVTHTTSANPASIIVNALNIPSALHGTQQMLESEGFTSRVISAEKFDDKPNEHFPTVGYAASAMPPAPRKARQ